MCVWQVTIVDQGCECSNVCNTNSKMFEFPNVCHVNFQMFKCQNAQMYAENFSNVQISICLPHKLLNVNN